MTENQIQNLLDIHEVQTTEFKRSTGEREEICKTICAFANADGGVILVGVNNDRTLSKVEFSETSQTEVTNLFVNFDPALTRLISLKKQMFKESYLLVIEVQKSEIDYHCYKDDCFQRVGASNKKISKEEYFYKRSKSRTEDWSDQICERATIKDLDPEAVMVLRQKMQNAKDNKEFATIELTNLLNRVGLANGDKLNNSCMIFLGKAEFTNRHYIDKNKISWTYRDEANRIEERLDLDIIQKPFILLLPIVLKQINRFNTVLQDLDIFREDIRQYDEKAVEEVLVNAIAHRDWEIPPWIEVVQTPKSLEIRNPGEFLADWDKVLESNQKPAYKNPTMVNFLNNIKLMEREGDGLRKVYKAQVSKGLKVKVRQLTGASDRVDLILTGKVENIDFAKFILQRRNEMDIETLRVLEKICEGKDVLDIDINQKEYSLVKDITFLSKRGNHINIKKHILQDGGVYEKEFTTRHITGDTIQTIIIDFAKKNKSGFSTSQIYDVLSGKRKTSIRVILSQMANCGSLIRISQGNYKINNKTI